MENNLGIPNWVNYEGVEINSIDDFEKNSIGFIYVIEMSNGRKYIGKKNLYSERKKHFGKKKLSEMTDKRLKTYEIIKKESDWKSYLGSNKQLKEDLVEGIRVVKREIIIECDSIKKLTFYELKALIIYDVLMNDEYYNDNILGKFFRKDLI